MEIGSEIMSKLPCIRQRGEDVLRWQGPVAAAAATAAAAKHWAELGHVRDVGRDRRVGVGPAVPEAEFGRIWSNLVEFGRIWSCHRIASTKISVREAQIQVEQITRRVGGGC